MKTIAVTLLLLLATACGVESSTPNSTCITPSTGANSCSETSWYWVNTSDAGKVEMPYPPAPHDCTMVECPSGSVCMISSNGELLLGHCQ